MAANGCAVVAVVVAAVAATGMHRVREGHVGAYHFGGALLDVTTEPGWHFAWPWHAREEVQVSVQSDHVTQIPCGTSQGVLLTFPLIEVVNRLDREQVMWTLKNYTSNYDKMWIFDKVHHLMNVFCSSHTHREIYYESFEQIGPSLQAALQSDCDLWAPGVRIISVRVTKPLLPADLEADFRQIEKEKSRFLVAVEAQKTARMAAETEQLQARMKAESAADVSRIRNQEEIDRKEAEKLMRQIEADGEHYASERKAAANEKLLTSQYLETQWAAAMASVSKIYYGPSIPRWISDSATANFRVGGASGTLAPLSEQKSADS